MASFIISSSLGQNRFYLPAESNFAPVTSDISRTLIEPLILRFGIVGLRLPRLLTGFEVHLMNLLRPGGMMREKKSEQTKREKKSASEGLVAITEKIWKLHRYLTPFDTNLDKNPCGLQAYDPTIRARLKFLPVFVQTG